MSRLAKSLNLDAIDIHMGVFDFTVRVVCGEYQSANKYIAKIFEIKNSEFDDFADDMNFGYEPRGKCYFRHGYIPIIWIPRYPTSPREYATLAHEALHSVWHLFEWANMPVTRDNEEMMAHAMAHIVNTYLEKGKKSGYTAVSPNR